MTAMTKMTGNETSKAAEPELTADVAHAASSHAQGQQHPIKLYLLVWGWLFVLSTCSYLVAVFMHMAWERLALVSAILLPPLAVLVLMAIMAWESDYTHFARTLFFGAGS